MYDAIVVGARCAGAPTAMLLARKGYRVLLADRAGALRDIPHGHFIHRHGPPRLARWGLLDRIARHCPPVTAFTLDVGDFPLTGRNLEVDGVAFGYAPRRIRLDTILLEAAAEAGVDVRLGLAVDSLVFEGDRVCGISGRTTPGGTAVVERARITIGADGRHSRVAAAAGAPVYDAVDAVTCWYFSYWSGVPAEGLEVYMLGDKMIFAFPTTDGLFGVFIAWPRAALDEVRGDIERHFMAAVDAVPAVSARLRSGRREERFAGASDLPNFFRRPFGPGWSLVGDAGYHKDPCLALGISDALRDAELLAEAIDDGLAGRCALQQSLASYEQQRNEASRQDYWQNLAGARFQPPPEQMLRARAAVRGNDAATRQLFLAREGRLEHPTPNSQLPKPNSQATV